ncbi:MAG: hypothetical protein R3F14_33500 [Polyangiaceae bacterium]
MRWEHLRVAPGGSHHIAPGGEPAYGERFDEVLKFHAPGLAPVARGGRAWHIHPDGAAAYSRRFARTFGFYEGLAAVSGDDGWHHISPIGADAYGRRHAWCGNFQGVALRGPRPERGLFPHRSSGGTRLFSPLSLCR